MPTLSKSGRDGHPTFTTGWRSMVEAVDQRDPDGDHHLGQCQVILMILVLGYGGLPDDPWLLWANVLLSSIVIAARLRNGWRKTLTCSEAFSSPHKIAWHCNTCRRIVGESLAAIVFFQLASTSLEVWSFALRSYGWARKCVKKCRRY